MVTKRFPIQLLFRIKHWLGQYVITMDIMRVGFPSLVQAYSRYTAIKLLLFLPLPLAIKQGVTGTTGTYTLPVSYLKFFTTVTGFGRDRSWGPVDSALTVCKNGLTSITLGCHESCSAYVITIGV